jgi:hypothetical protein
MDLLNLVVLDLASDSSGSWEKGAETKSVVSARLPMTDKTAHVIDIHQVSSHSNLEDRIASLRACYSRLVLRISQLLWLHTSQKISIEPYYIHSLLNSIHTTARASVLHPFGSISTHHPQTNSSGIGQYRFIIPVPRDTLYTVRSDDLNGSPLGSLIAILRMRPSIKEELLLQTRMAALFAFSALAPVLLQQHLGISRAELLDVLNFKTWPHTPPGDMQGIRYIAVRQMLLVLRYMGRCLPAAAPHLDFFYAVTELIFDYVAEDNKEPGYEGPRLAIAHNCGDLIPLLEFAGASESNLSMLTNNMMFNLIDTTRLTITSEGITPCDTLLTPSCFPPLIRMIGLTTNLDTSAEQLLQAIVRRMRRRDSDPQQKDIPWNNIPSIDYLHRFTRTDQGFAALADSARNEDYVEVVTSAIADITRLAAGQDLASVVSPIELCTPAVPGFLEVISTMAKYCSGVKDRDSMLLGFSKDALDLVAVALKDEESKEHIIAHSAYHDLGSALQAVEDLDAAKALTDRLHELWGEREIEVEGE